MRVPTANYSPLIQAHQNRKAANSVQNISAKIDYQRKSQELEGQGLQLRGKAIQLNDSYSRFQTGMQVGKLLAAAASAAEAAQSQKASAMVNRMQGDTQTKQAEWVANGDLRVQTEFDGARRNADGTTRIVGIDKLQSLRNQQIDEINKQPWAKSVKNKAIDALDGFYHANENRMFQEFYAKETADRFKLEQINLDNAVNEDIATGSFYTTKLADDGSTVKVQFADYSNVDKYIEDNPNYSPRDKALLKTSVHEQIDMGRAMNEVRNITMAEGHPAGVAIANQIADEKKYDPTTRQKLIHFADMASSQAKTAALAQGTMFMDQSIQAAQAKGETPDFNTIYDQAKQNTQGLSDEAGKAYMDAVEQGHLDYLTNVFYENTKDDPETMGDVELEEKIAALEELKPMFDATPATRKLYANMTAAYKKQYNYNKRIETAEQEAERKASEAQDKANRDYYVKTSKAILKNLVPSFMAGDITASELMDNVKTIMAGAEASRGWIGNDNAYDISTIGMDIINSLDSKIEAKNKGSFDALKKTISEDAKAWYKVKKDSDLSDEQKQEILQNQLWAEASLLEVLRNNPTLSDAELNKEIQNITALYKVKNIEALSGPITVTTKTTKEEEAMTRTAAFQDYEQSYTYFDSKDKKLKLNPKFEKEYDNAALIERDMLRENYGIDVKDEYTIMRYGDKMVPMFEDKDNLKYIVMDGKVYQWYKNGQIAEKPQQKPFVSEGYEEIPGLTRHLMGDANAFNDAGSKESREKLYGYLR